MKNRVEAFVEKYQLYKEDTIQQIQLEHRFNLVETFKIRKGMHVLEIGCGQGDTTVVLADMVGKEGKVVAIDIASPNYGMPFTLGQAIERIKQSELGARIDFHLETELLNFPITQQFDVVVLSHCSWYFESEQKLADYFKRLRHITKRVCFAEWDLRFSDLSQRGHFCAVTILALYSQFVKNDGNIQHVFGESQIENLMAEAGFTLQDKETIDASFLQDGLWEMDYATSIQNEFNQVPSTIQALVSNYYDVMNENIDKKSLNSFVLIFEA